MKKLILVLSAILIITGISKAQSLKTIPNASFETWDSTISYDLDSPWVTSNSFGPSNIATVTKVPGFLGSAVHVQAYNDGNNSVPGLAYVAIPYNQKPTGIKGYFRCNESQDTGFLIVGFTKAGVFLEFDTIYFHGSVNTFTPFNHTISLSDIPDTVGIIAVSGNYFSSMNPNINPNDWIELDQLEFTGTGITQQIPNGDFESWHSTTVYNPSGWLALPTYGPASISRSTDHYDGNYSLKITEEPYNAYTQITTGTFSQFGTLSGGTQYNIKDDTLSGYYKYSTDGDDSGGIAVTVQRNDTVITAFSANFLPTTSWTYFEVPINSPVKPDTMRIDLFSSLNYLDTTGNCTLLIDKLQLKSQPHTSAIPAPEKPEFGITAFPNPAQNQLNIRFIGSIPTESSIKIYNSEGRLMIDNQFNSGSSTVTVPIGQLSIGLYFYEVTENGYVIRNKFVKD